MVKIINTMKNQHQLTGKTASYYQNGSTRFTHNNINPKCKWTQCTNQKTQTGKLDKKPKPIRLTEDLSAETLQARREWGQYSTSLKKELSTQNFISRQTKLHK